MNRKHFLRKHNTLLNHKAMHLHIWAFCCVSYSIHELPYQKIPLNKDIEHSTSSVQWVTDLGKDNCPCYHHFPMEKNISFSDFPHYTFFSKDIRKIWDIFTSLWPFPFLRTWKRLCLIGKPYFDSFACLILLPVTSSGISKWHQILPCKCNDVS